MSPRANSDTPTTTPDEGPPRVSAESRVTMMTSLSGVLVTPTGQKTRPACKQGGFSFASDQAAEVWSSST